MSAMKCKRIRGQTLGFHPGEARAGNGGLSVGQRCRDAEVTPPAVELDESA